MSIDKSKFELPYRFDVTRAATFDAVIKWKEDLDSKVTLPDGSPIPCMLLANKVS